MFRGWREGGTRRRFEDGQTVYINPLFAAFCFVFFFKFLLAFHVS